MKLLQVTKRAVVRSGQAGRLSAVLDRIGAHGLASRVRPTPPPEVVEVALPRIGSGPTRLIRMHALEGRDQVARALRSGGWEGFEPPLPSVVVATLRRWPGLFLDVGANTGLYSLIATAAHDQATAIAFEPVPGIVSLLRDNLALNKGGRRVTVDERAIGDSVGSATLHLPVPQADGTIETSASLESDFKEVIDQTFTVRTSTLDQVWQDLGRPMITMIKIDVEGSEARVLAGAGELIVASQPLISVEVLDRVDPAPLEQIRADLGYVDISLSAQEAIVGWPRVQVVADAPNHLLVPPDRLPAVVEDLRSMRSLRVSAPD